MLLSALGYMYLFKLACFFFFFQTHLGVRLLGDVVGLFLDFEEDPYCSPLWLHQFTSPPTVYKCSLLSTFSPTFWAYLFLMQTPNPMPPARSSVRYSCPKPKVGKKPFCPSFMFSCRGTPIQETHLASLYADLLLLRQRSISLDGEKRVWLSPYLTPLISGSTCLQKARISAAPCHQAFILLEYSWFTLWC